MSPIQLFKALIVVAALAYLAISDSEARAVNEVGVDELLAAANSAIIKGYNNGESLPILMGLPKGVNPSEQADLDDEQNDDDEQMLDQQVPAPANSQLHYNSQQASSAPSSDLKTSASHHHHGHGAKGWLDMGAWTGKKGAFGWYDKHPVGKGK